jgi:hypothetical protein
VSRTQSVVSHDETKPSFKTTELFTMLGIVAAILIAAASAENLDAPRAWTLVAVAVVASAFRFARARQVRQPARRYGQLGRGIPKR